MSYEAFEKTMASFDSSLTELKEELARIESELAKAEAAVGEQIRLQALGKGGNIAEARQKVQELREKRRDVLEMIQVVEKEKKSQLRKLFQAVREHYVNSVKEKIEKEAKAQIERIKAAKARYLYEILKLKELKDKYNEENSRFTAYCNLVGEENKILSGFPGFAYKDSWSNSFTPGITEHEVRNALNGQLHPEVKKYIEKIH